MAEFLTTTGVSAHLEKIISDSNREIFLISPYLKINQRMKDLLTDADRMRRDIRIIYGKNELQPDEGQWLQGLSEVKLYFRKNLHAKCYLNEQHAVVTSMNLYEFSQVNNDEMGILVSASEDQGLYGKIYEEAKKLMRSADPVKLTVEKLPDNLPATSTVINRAAAAPAAPPSKPSQASGTPSRTQPTLVQRFGIRRTDLKPEMVEARRTHPRAYEPWTKEEEDALIEMARRRMDVEEVARQLGRQPSAIDRKLKDLS